MEETYKYPCTDCKKSCEDCDDRSMLDRRIEDRDQGSNSYAPDEYK